MSFWVMGDVHGHTDAVRRLLVAEGLMDAEDRWSGADAVLWFVGDFVDRGPDGIGAIELVMSLERQAADAGGKVASLLGNHELFLLAAERFGERPVPGGMSFAELWAVNGGVQSDLERITDVHREWIRNLPAMVLEQDRLLVHADSAGYADYGGTVEEVCAAVTRVFESDDPVQWDGVGRVLCDRHTFERQPRAARWMLQRFGGRRLIHGHTPIPFLTRMHPSRVVMPLVYCDGLCVNVDGGIFTGGPGFLHHEPDAV